MMMLNKQNRIVLTGAVIAIFTFVLIGTSVCSEEETQLAVTSPPVLSVALTNVEEELLPIHVPATGNIVPWQEAIIGAEIDGLRLIEVQVNVGDTVKRGQLLARFNADIVEAELAEAHASVAQAEAETLEAEANHRRAKSLENSRAISTQQVEQTMVAAMRARARQNAARAVKQKNRVRLVQTRVVAPSDGIISARAATVGAVVSSGQELFRLIEDGRLEWRAVVAMSDINTLTQGQIAHVTVRDQDPIEGTLRMVAPTIDSQTHTGLAYVDFPAGSLTTPNAGLRAGSFAQGYFEVSDAPALTLPQRAVVLRDGFHYVMQVGPNSTITLKKVILGRRIGERVEITDGLAAAETVIASGLGFLSEGDVVRVVSDLANYAHEGSAPQNHSIPQNGLMPASSNNSAESRL